MTGLSYCHFDSNSFLNNVQCTVCSNKINFLFYISFIFSNSSVKVFNVLKKTRIPVIMIKESYGVQLREVLHR
jgi:hypothetical protein